MTKDPTWDESNCMKENSQTISDEGQRFVTKMHRSALALENYIENYITSITVVALFSCYVTLLRKVGSFRSNFSHCECSLESSFTIRSLETLTPSQGSTLRRSDRQSEEPLGE